MKQRKRRYFTAADIAVIWDRWEKGDSLNAIARDLGRGHSAVQGVLARSGGIRPAQRTRSQRTLSIAEREEISRGVVAGFSLRFIAGLLNRAPSTVSREIKRNGGVFDGVSSSQLDGARTDPARAKNTPDGQVGGWFYRLVSPGEQLEDLTSLVVEINLQSGVSNALDSKLDSVIAALDDANENNDGAALNSMYAFCNSVSAQRGKKIDDADADELIAAASAIITTIDEFAPGCE